MGPRARIYNTPDNTQERGAGVPACGPRLRPIPGPRQTSPARRPAPRPSDLPRRGAGVPACDPRSRPLPGPRQTSPARRPAPRPVRPARPWRRRPCLRPPIPPAPRPTPNFAGTEAGAAPVRPATPWRRRPCLRSPIPPAPQLTPNLAGTEAGVTPGPACPAVAQASLPAVPDPARSPAHAKLHRHGGRRHARSGLPCRKCTTSAEPRCSREQRHEMGSRTARRTKRPGKIEPAGRPCTRRDYPKQTDSNRPQDGQRPPG